MNLYHVYLQRKDITVERCNSRLIYKYNVDPPEIPRKHVCMLAKYLSQKKGRVA
jgi:hypothetical protein